MIKVYKVVLASSLYEISKRASARTHTATALILESINQPCQLQKRAQNRKQHFRSFRRRYGW